jgi:hypothetical protein
VKQGCGSILLSALAVLIVVPAALAKGIANKITISGPGLSEPIEITNRELLSRFSPWSNAFLDQYEEPLKDLSAADNLYEVEFYLQDSAGNLQVGYVFYYAPGQPGTIYFPGMGEVWYQTNSSLRYGEGQDGNWFVASRAWDDAIQPLIVSASQSAGGEAGGADPKQVVAVDPIQIGHSDPGDPVDAVDKNREIPPPLNPGRRGSGFQLSVYWLGLGIGGTAALILGWAILHNRKGAA